MFEFYVADMAYFASFVNNKRPASQEVSLL